MSDLPTVGVEEEFLLVDPRTGEPAPRNTEVAAEAETRGVTLQLELSSCQVETTSSVATTSAQLGEELAGLRRTAAQASEGQRGSTAGACTSAGHAAQVPGHRHPTLPADRGTVRHDRP